MLNKKKQILFFIQLPPPVHGVSIMNQLIINNPLINEKFSVSIVEMKFSDSFSEIRKYNLKKLFRFLKVYRNLRKKLKDCSPEIVYFSFIPIGIGFLRDYIFLRLIRKFNTKIILHLNNRGINERSRNLFYRRLYRSTFKNITIIHISEGLMEEEFKNISIQNCKKYTINNTCEPYKIIPEKKKDHLINILFLSNLFPEKGVSIAIKAFIELYKSYPSIRLHIYGQALRMKYEKEILRYINLNELTDIISYHGMADPKTKAQAFAQADIFIFPSYFKEECIPVSILEAMHAGLPIVASRIGAIPEIIENNVNGILFEPGNIEDLVKKISLLLENKPLREKLGSYARSIFHEKYNYEKFSESFFRMINEISFD